jgi:hypothetical protein
MVKVNSDNKLKWIFVGLVIGIVVSLVTSIVMNYFLPPGTIIFESLSKCFSKETASQLFNEKLKSLQESMSVACEWLVDPIYHNHIWYRSASCKWVKKSEQEGFLIAPPWHPLIHMILLDNVGWTSCDTNVYYYVEERIGE